MFQKQHKNEPPHDGQANFLTQKSGSDS